jgi:CYTH domain-containing protein
MMSRVTEIERKWVRDAPPGELAHHPSRHVEQGYVALDEAAEVRVRRAVDKRTLTIKSAPGMVRTEVELALEEEQFGGLWPLTEGRRVVKTRHEVPLGDGLTAEVDVYEDALEGLVTVEVEFPSEEAAERFAAPDWFGRDVTGDKRYANRALAVDGLP